MRVSTLQSITILLICPIVMTILAGCNDTGSGREKGDAQGNSGESSKTHVGLTCGASCAPQVAALSNPYDPAGAVDCTTSLVGEKDGHSVVLTNRKCTIGLDLNSSCGRLTVAFPEQERLPAVNAQCAKIIEVTPDAIADGKVIGEARDYALIELDRKIDRPKYFVRAAEIRDQESLTINYLDKSDPTNYVIRNRQCHAAMNTVFDKSFKDSRDRRATLVACETSQGSGGGPVIDGHGNLVGLLNNQIDIGTPERASGDFVEAFHANLILRLGCIESKILNTKVDAPEQCAKQKAKRFFKDDIGDEINAKIHEAMGQWMRQDKQKIFTFDLDYSASPEISLQPNQVLLRALTFKPLCFNVPAENWLKPFRVKSWAGMRNSLVEDTNVRYEMLVVYAYYEPDPKLGARTEVKATTQPLDLSFSPSSFAETGISEVRINDQYNKIAIGTCTAEQLAQPTLLAAPKTRAR